MLPKLNVIYHCCVFFSTIAIEIKRFMDMDNYLNDTSSSMTIYFSFRFSFDDFTHHRISIDTFYCLINACKSHQWRDIFKTITTQKIQWKKKLFQIVTHKHIRTHTISSIWTKENTHVFGSEKWKISCRFFEWQPRDSTN